MPINELRNQLCESRSTHCRKCFDSSTFKSRQNPPNVFRATNSGTLGPIAFIFDKPNDNTNLRNSELVPITIFDDRAGVAPGLLRAPSHSKLISLCKLLDLITPTTDCLDSPNLYITNAVKCDLCSETGRTGRVRINARQAEECVGTFLLDELQIVKPRALVFFGANAQRYVLGKTTPLWEIHQEQLSGHPYLVMRVPHTSPTPFNTHGGGGNKYIEPFKELNRRANDPR